MIITKIKDVAREKAVELGIDPDVAAFACLGIGKCIQEKMASVNLYDEPKENYTEEELDKLSLKFNLYKLGRLVVTYPHYKHVRKYFKDVKNRKNNTSV